MTDYAHPEVLVETAWVQKHLQDPKVRFRFPVLANIAQKFGTCHNGRTGQMDDAVSRWIPGARRPHDPARIPYPGESDP